MGASEFEWGAIPKAYRELKINGLKPTLVKIQLEEELHVFVQYPNHFDETDVDAFNKWLVDHYIGKESPYSLEEQSYFDKKSRTGYFDCLHKDIDFWWDIQNNVMWSHDKMFMRRLPMHLKASFDYIDAHNNLKSA